VAAAILELLTDGADVVSIVEEATGIDVTIVAFPTVGAFVGEVLGAIVGTAGQHVASNDFKLTHLSLTDSTFKASASRSPHVFPSPIAIVASTVIPPAHTSHGFTAGTGQQLSSASFISAHAIVSASRSGASTRTSSQVFPFPTTVVPTAVIPEAHTEQGFNTAGQHVASAAGTY